MEDKIGGSGPSTKEIADAVSEKYNHVVKINYNRNNQILNISGYCRHLDESIIIVNEKLFSFISKLGLSRDELNTLFYVAHRIANAQEEAKMEREQ